MNLINKVKTGSRETIAQRRVDNYHALAHKLDRVALFSNLPAQVILLGFPIRTKERDKVRQALFAHEIYPPVHSAIRGGCAQ